MPNKLPYNPVKGVSKMYHPLFERVLIGQTYRQVLFIATSSPDVSCLQHGLMTRDERVFSVYRDISGTTLLLVQYPFLQKVLYKEVTTTYEIKNMFGKGPLARSLYHALGWDGINCQERAPDAFDISPWEPLPEDAVHYPTRVAL